jgi:hypothetical protein
MAEAIIDEQFQQQSLAPTNYTQILFANAYSSTPQAHIQNCSAELYSCCRLRLKLSQQGIVAQLQQPLFSRSRRGQQRQPDNKGVWMCAHV